MPADSITPGVVRGFLDLLTEEAIVTEAAVREAAPWSPEDSADHRALRDRLVLAVAMDSMLSAQRAATPHDSATDPEALGRLARDHVVARLGPSYENAALASLAHAFGALPRPSSDSSLAAQLRVLGRLPVLTRADSMALLARSSEGNVLAGEVVSAWARLSVAYRPRIETPAQVKALVDNLLFERVLRATAGSRFEHDASVTAALTTHAEHVWRQGYLERHVLAGIQPDSAALAAYWRAHADDWTLPPRVRGIRLVLDNLSAAARMRMLLADPATAESLAVRAERHGLDYRFEVSAHVDSTLYRRAVAAGPGSVVGPVAQDGAFWVARVAEVRSSRQRAFLEVRDDVARRWYAEEAERRAHALAHELRVGLRVEAGANAAARLFADLQRTARSKSVAEGR